jgi:hypothetical protein
MLNLLRFFQVNCEQSDVDLYEDGNIPPDCLMMYNDNLGFFFGKVEFYWETQFFNVPSSIMMWVFFSIMLHIEN